ncbi:FtsK/SpoIIIE family DNA translocase [Candidatus Mycalebacterium sp.]
MTKNNGGFGNQVAAIALFLFGAIIAVSLVMGGSLSPLGGGAVGWIGKFISKILGTVFGISSYLIPAGFFYFSARFMLSKMDLANGAQRTGAFAGLLVSSALFAALALEGVFLNHLTIVGAGGNLGALILNFTDDSIGSFGSYIVAVTVMAGCLIFLLETNLVAVATAFFKVVKLLGAGAVAVLKFCVPLFMSARAASKALFSFIVKTVKKRGEKAKPSAREKPPVKTGPSPAPPESPPCGEKKDETPPKIVVTEKEPEKPPLKIVPDKSAEEQKPQRSFNLPPIDLLDKPAGVQANIDQEAAYANARLIEEKLQGFGIEGKVTEIKPGPVITMFEYKPAPNVRVGKIASLSNDLAMSLSALKVRIISPIPGRDVVGIEVPNQVRETVCLRELIENQKFAKSGPLTIAVGKDISGTPYYTDLATAPHLMIAGTTGSGKSVLMNSLLASMFYKAGPDRLRLLMIDPKMLEFSIYEGIPHLLHPIVTEPRKASAALKWAVGEMENRYSLLSGKGVRSIDSYNAKIEGEEGADSAKILPYIVIVIDELGDLVMSGTNDTQGAIIRIAQKARAAGIHLVVATQRPSADVVSGLLKANIPARISFLVSSRINSNIVLDAPGAESLLGKGDMLFLKPGAVSLERIQGALITDDEREKIVKFLKSQGGPVFDEKIAEVINKPEQSENGGGDGERDDMYEQALEVVRAEGQVSISMLQRRLKIGYNRAATIVEQMEREGIVGEHQGAGKARDVNLPSEEQ